LTFAIEILPAARRELEALDTAVRRRIDRKILLLASDPRPSGSKKLQGHDLMRVRAGDYRIVYTVRDQRLIVAFGNDAWTIVRVEEVSKHYGD
jgi:mRNA interferase RelE/StbE